MTYIKVYIYSVLLLIALEIGHLYSYIGQLDHVNPK